MGVQQAAAFRLVALFGESRECQLWMPSIDKTLALVRSLRLLRF